MSGYGGNQTTGHFQALLWIGPPPGTATPCPPDIAPAATYTTGTNPSAVAVGDLNGDGFPDLIVANYSSHDGSILINNGNGTFGSPMAFGTTGGFPYCVATGDFNGDGKMDFAVGNYGGWLSPFHGNGDGTIGSAPQVFGVRPRSIAVGDFNHDNIPDLAVASDSQPASTVSILRGLGDGEFANPLNYGSGNTGAGHSGVIVGDLNGDGWADVAVSNGADNSVSVLLNDLTGNFPTDVKYPVGTSPYGIAAADFNGDGILDLAVANSDAGTVDSTSNTVSVLRGNGNGTFQPALFYSTGGTGVYSITTGDLNGDGKPDIVVTHLSGSVSVLINNGFTFQAPLGYTVGSGANAVAVADLNGDGRPDLVSANNAASTVSVLRRLPTDPQPSVIAQPGPQNTCRGGTASFTATATSSGTDPYTFVWRKGGVALNPANPRYAFTLSPDGRTGTLTITNANSADAGNGPTGYSAVITNACAASATTTSATLAVCAADFNCSGSVTVQDIFDFLGAWFPKCTGQAGSPCNGRSADVNNSGTVTVQDIFDFLSAWFAKCP